MEVILGITTGNTILPLQISIRTYRCGTMTRWFLGWREKCTIYNVPHLQLPYPPDVVLDFRVTCPAGHRLSLSEWPVNGVIIHSVFKQAEDRHGSEQYMDDLAVMFHGHRLDSAFLESAEAMNRLVPSLQASNHI